MEGAVSEEFQILNGYFNEGERGSGGEIKLESCAYTNTDFRTHKTPRMDKKAVVHIHNGVLLRH